MATQEQIGKWCDQVMALIDKDVRNVDDIIQRRGGARMSTLLALKHLQATGVIFRHGNSIHKY